MPPNSAEYQKQVRERNKNKWKEPSVRLSIEQHNEFSVFAKKNDMSLSSLMRTATELQIRSSTMKGREFKVIADELKELKRLLLNFTNNLNQIAHHSNEIQRVVDENEVLMLIRGLEITINDFVDLRMKNTE